MKNPTPPRMLSRGESIGALSGEGLEAAMVSLIISSMMAMSLVVAATYLSYSTLQSSQNVSAVQRSSAQMWQLAALVQANLRPVKGDGVLYPPAPAVDATGRTILPAWLVADARSPWGASYGYCVYAPAPQAATVPLPAVPAAAGGAASIAPVVAAASSGVAAPVLTAPYPYAGAPGAHDYAVAAPALPAALAGRDIVALVLASAMKSDKPARCEDVVLEQGQLGLAGGGQVVSIGQRATNDLAALSAGARVERVVTPVPAGTATGADLADGMTLEAALGFWQATRPNTMVLRLAPGRHGVSAALLASLADDGQVPAGGRLVLSALGDGAVVAGEAAGAVLKIPGDLRIDGVGFDGLGVEAMPGTRLELRGRTTITAVGIPAVHAAFATLLVRGELQVASDGDAIRVEGGRAVFRDASVAATVGQGGSAVTSSAGATVAFSSVTMRSRLSVSGTGMPLAAIRSGGALTVLDHTDVALNSATQFGTVLEGGAFEMIASTLGQPGARAAAGGVLDLGGSRVASDAVSEVWLAPGARCGSGALFAQTAVQQTTGAPAAGSQGTAAPVVLVSTATTANRAGWLCRN